MEEPRNKMFITQTDNNEHSRSSYWDNCKGFLIILVVFAHFLYDLQAQHEWNTVLVNAIYMFHMPAFVFVSGYFSKSENSRSLRSILLLTVAYFLYTTGFIVFNLFNGIPGISLTYPYYSAWYILALVIWRLVTPYIAKIRGIMFLLISFSVLSGFWTEFDLKYTAVKVIVFYPFFMAGYLLQPEMVKKFQQISSKKRILAGVFLLCIATVCGFLATKYFHVTMQDMLPNYYVRQGLEPAFARVSILVVAGFCIVSMLLISDEKQIPLLTKAGRNTLAVYLLHRPVTLWFTGAVLNNSEQEQILKACVGTFLIISVFGSEVVSGSLKKFLNICADSLLGISCGSRIKYTLCRILLLVCFFDILLLPVLGQLSQQKSTDSIYRIMDYETQENYNKSFRLLFCGDLILLEDQVKNAYNGKGYDFTPCFEYTKKYISSADFAIGVFEGPLAGNSKSYSNSNYEDGKELYLNFPDEFADAVKEAGFDLVTTANNHLLDMGEVGIDRTIRVLKEKGLDFTGSYINETQKEAERVKIVEKDGIRMAFLAYTYGVNNFDTEKVLESDLRHRTSFLIGKGSPHYNEVKESVRKDFEKAKSFKPDLIIVLPHWGTQFADKPDSFQTTWQQNFLDFGADIIFGDHTHSVQPMEMKEVNGKMTYTLFCPGNYANIYREHNGDASALVEVAIDRITKKIIGSSMIPMWTESAYRGNYRALPVWEILTDEKLGKEISTHDMKRVSEVTQHITKIMLGEKLDLDRIQERLFFDKKGFLRKKVEPLTVSMSMKDGIIYPLLKNSKTVCFVGDSITEGTKNGGIPWYEPIEHLVSGSIKNISVGGCTTKMLLEKKMFQDIVTTKADVFVIAVGTNDIRYRDAKICAMTSEEYTTNLQALQKAIKEKQPEAKFIFITPWTSIDGDLNSKLPFTEKMAMNLEYSVALKKWCSESGNIFVDPNKFIADTLNRYPHGRYLTDFIHPNGRQGVQLYSECVLMCNGFK